MKRSLLASSAFALVMGSGFFSAATVQAADQCIRVLGYESDGEKQTMDPAALIGTDSVYHIRAVYEPLVDRSNAMLPIPVLAQSWESNADATEWTFHLRQGVKFHDGSDFDAADVVYSYRRLLDPAISPGGFSTLSFLDADGISAVDAHTVRFKVKSPVVELPMLIATKYALMVPEGAKGADLRRDRFAVLDHRDVDYALGLAAHQACGCGDFGLQETGVEGAVMHVQVAIALLLFGQGRQAQAQAHQ